MGRVHILGYVLRRVAQGVLTLVAVTFITYVLMDRGIDGGTESVVLGECPRDATEGFCGAIVAKYRLDEPTVMRYLGWLGDALRGDLNRTDQGNNDVMELIRSFGPITLQISVSAILLALLIAVPLGMYSAARDGRASGTAVSIGVQVTQTIPVFVTGLAAIWIFAEWLDLLPAAGWTRPTDSLGDNLQRAILPIVTLAFAEVASFARVLRADLVEVLRQDYIQAARVRGLSNLQIMLRHALRPGSFGLMTVVGINATNLLGGVMIVEQVFGLPGIGAAMFEGIRSRDLYLVLGITLFMGLVTVIIGAIVDVLYQVLDPRITPAMHRQRSGRAERTVHASAPATAS